MGSVGPNQASSLKEIHTYRRSQRGGGKHYPVPPCTWTAWPNRSCLIRLSKAPIPLPHLSFSLLTLAFLVFFMSERSEVTGGSYTSAKENWNPRASPYSCRHSPGYRVPSGRDNPSSHCPVQEQECTLASSVINGSYKANSLLCL